MGEVITNSDQSMPISDILQATQAPPAPPIPALPARPGAATGTQAAPGAATAGPQEGRLAEDIRRAASEAEATIRETVRNSLEQQGQAGTQVPPPYRDTGVPDEVIPLVGMSLGLVVAMVVGFPIARAIGRVIEKRGSAGLIKATDVAPQLQQLQQSVDAMAVELERIGESQRFTARLMSERGAALPRGESASG